MPDEIDVSQTIGQIEYAEEPEIKVTQLLAQIEVIYGPTGIDMTQVLAQVEYVAGTSGPTMAQLMRHGKWFGDGVRKSFFWAK